MKVINNSQRLSLELIRGTNKWQLYATNRKRSRAPWHICRSWHFPCAYKLYHLTERRMRTVGNVLHQMGKCVTMVAKVMKIMWKYLDLTGMIGHHRKIYYTYLYDLLPNLQTAKVSAASSRIPTCNWSGGKASSSMSKELVSVIAAPTFTQGPSLLRLSTG